MTRPKRRPGTTPNGTGKAVRTCGPDGMVPVRRITVAVAAAHPRPTNGSDEDAWAEQRLRAALACAADQGGRLPDWLQAEEAAEVAGLKSRDGRKAWSALERSGALKATQLTVEQTWPLVLCDDGRVQLLTSQAADLTADDLDAVPAWIDAALGDLRQRGLPTWQEELAASRLAKAAVAVVTAVGTEDDVCEQLRRAEQAFAAQAELARRQLERAHDRLDEALETERHLLAELADLEKGLAALADPSETIAEAVALARDVLAAAELLESGAP